MIPPQEFRELDDGTRTNAQLAAAFKVTDRTINRWRRILGTTHPQRDPLSPQELAQIRAFLEDGVPYSEVAMTLGRSERHIRAKFPGYKSPPGIVLAQFRRQLEAINPERKSA